MGDETSTTVSLSHVATLQPISIHHYDDDGVDLLATPAVGAQQSNSGMDNQEAIHQLTVISINYHCYILS